MKRRHLSYRKPASKAVSPKLRARRERVERREARIRDAFNFCSENGHGLDTTVTVNGRAD